jgi:DNA-binding NtrC family response regulator
MIEMLARIRRFADLEAPVLVEGETGTGKELVARALHVLSRRGSAPMIATDCATLPEAIAESELFGHERGAFTGADRFQAGRFEAAAGGTVFLDEVNSLSLTVQAKLLRFLETSELFRLGHARPISVDVRVIAAANESLEELVAAGRIRADFFHRLKVLHIRVPPLRERLDDIELLVGQFLQDDPLAKRFEVRAVSDAAIEALRARSWTGNVRELWNLLRRSIATAADGPILRHLLDDTRSQTVEADLSSAQPPFPTFREWIREREREYFTALRARFSGAAEQARASALPERTLYRKVCAAGCNLLEQEVSAKGYPGQEVQTPTRFPKIGSRL